MDIDLLMARMEAESAMKDHCVIPGPPTKTWDEGTASYIITAGAPIYDGKCRVKVDDVQVQEKDVQGQHLIEQRLRLDLPVSASTSVHKGHVATITASDNDPAQVGRQFRITGPHAQTFASARRFPVEEVS